MLSLCGFPDLPPPGEISVCEVNGMVCSMQKELANISYFTDSIKRHPVINVTRELACTRDEGVSMYLEVEDTLLKRLTSVWYKQGFIEALKVAADPQNRQDNKILMYPALYTLKIANLMTKIRHIFQPHLKDLGPKLTALYSHTRDWSNSPVRYLAWHPHTTKIAVVTADDNVRIYSCDSVVNPTLKCGSQKGVSMVAWRPYSTSEIAVACEIGVVVWTVDPNSIFSKPSVSNATIYRSPSHKPITSLCWSPEGSLLLAGSPAGCEVQVWGPGGASCCFRRLAGGGTSLLEFAPDGTRLLSATTSMIFRVWETTCWQAEKWSVRGGRVQAACWSPDSEVLLFATEEEPLVYALKFANATLFADDKNIPAVATPVIDLSKVELSGGETAGGRVLDLRWSPKGHHLAITFKESPVIAIFNISVQGTLRITPCCFLSGVNNEVANVIAFQQNFNEGACLSVGWSSGRVQHFPVIYSCEEHIKGDSLMMRSI